MDKIEIGEYVRTNNGLIGKVNKIEPKGSGLRFVGEYLSEEIIQFNDSKFYERRVKEKDIVKHSKNIIDLIETDDIVILEYYVAKYKQRITRKFEVFKCNNLISFNNIHCDFLYNLNKNTFVDGKGYNVKIKKILTKEQFNQNCYEVEES